MPVPSIIDDGAWSVFSPYSIEYEFPFSDKGDTTTFIAWVKYRINKFSYVPMAAMTAMSFPFGTAYLCKLGRPRDIGNGIYEVENGFYSVPITRTEYGTFNITIQWFESITNTGADPSKYFYNVTYDLTENSFTVGANFYYEYFLYQPPQPLIKPTLFFIFSQLYNRGGSPPGNGQIIGEDSMVSIYAGRIFERRTPYVPLTPSGLIG